MAEVDLNQVKQDVMVQAQTARDSVEAQASEALTVPPKSVNLQPSMGVDTSATNQKAVEDWKQSQLQAIDNWESTSIDQLNQPQAQGTPQVTYEGLTTEEQQVLKDYGIEQVQQNRQLAAEQQYGQALQKAQASADVVQVAGNQYISKSDWNSLSPEDQALLNQVGIDQFNQKYSQTQQAAAESQAFEQQIAQDRPIALANAEAIRKQQEAQAQAEALARQYSALQQQQQASTNTQIPTFQTGAQGSSKPVDSQGNSLTPVGNGEYIKTSDFEPLNLAQQNYLKANGIAAYNKRMAQYESNVTVNQPLQPSDVYSSLTKQLGYQPSLAQMQSTIPINSLYPETPFLSSIPLVGGFLAGIEQQTRLGGELVLSGLVNPFVNPTNQDTKIPTFSPQEASFLQAQPKLAAITENYFANTLKTQQLTSSLPVENIVKAGAATVEAFFPIARGLNPNVGFQNVQPSEYLNTAINAALIAAPKIVPPIVQGIKSLDLFSPEWRAQLSTFPFSEKPGLAYAERPTPFVESILKPFTVEAPKISEVPKVANIQGSLDYMSSLLSEKRVYNPISSYMSGRIGPADFKMTPVPESLRVQNPAPDWALRDVANHLGLSLTDLKPQEVPLVKAIPEAQKVSLPTGWFESSPGRIMATGTQPIPIVDIPSAFKFPTPQTSLKPSIASFNSGLQNLQEAHASLIGNTTTPKPSTTNLVRTPSIFQPQVSSSIKTSFSFVPQALGVKVTSPFIDSSVKPLTAPQVFSKPTNLVPSSISKPQGLGIKVTSPLIDSSIKPLTTPQAQRSLISQPTSKPISNITSSPLLDPTIRPIAVMPTRNQVIAQPNLSPSNFPYTQIGSSTRVIAQPRIGPSNYPYTQVGSSTRIFNQPHNLSNPQNQVRNLSQQMSQTQARIKNMNQVRNLAQVEPQTRTELQNQTMTKLRELTRPQTQTKLRELVRVRTQTRVREPLKPRDEASRKFWPKLSPKEKPIPEEKNLPPGTVTWNQGIQKKVIIPGDQKPRSFYRPLHPKGSGIPSRTLKVVGGPSNIKEARIDLGVEDIVMNPQKRSIKFKSGGSKTSISGVSNTIGMKLFFDKVRRMF